MSQTIRTHQQNDQSVWFFTSLDVFLRSCFFPAFRATLTSYLSAFSGWSRCDILKNFMATQPHLEHIGKLFFCMFWCKAMVGVKCFFGGIQDYFKHICCSIVISLISLWLEIKSADQWVRFKITRKKKHCLIYSFYFKNICLLSNNKLKIYDIHNDKR